MIKSEIIPQAARAKWLKESELIPRNLYAFHYGKDEDATKIICLATAEKNLVVVGVISKSNEKCSDKPGDVWPLNGEGDGLWQEFKDAINLSNS